MNYYRPVFLRKICFEIIRKKWGNYSLILILSGQSCDSKNYFKKFRLYVLQIIGVAKNLKHFKF